MADKLRRMKDRASRLYAEGKLREALEVYAHIVSEDGRELGCRIKMGDIHRRLGNQEGAVQAYEEVAARYAEDGLLLKAIAVCKLILVSDPDHTSTQAMLADLYARRRGSSAEVPALPLSEAAAQSDAMSAWPGGIRTIDPDEPPSRADSVLSAWPSTVVKGEALGQAWPIVQGHPVSEESLEFEVTEHLEEEHQVEEEPLELDIIDEEPAEAAAAFSAETFEGEVHVREVLEGTPESPPPAKHAPPLIPLFSDLPKKAFVEILVRMKMHQLRRGESVIREGESGDSFYVIASGMVSVSRKDQDGKEISLAHLGEGAFFGEMALLQNGVRTATVRVEEDAQIFEISRQLLDEVINQYPTVATAVRNFYRQRLLATAMATHALFAPLPRPERRLLMEQFKSRSFQAGEIILEEGKKGNGLYLLLHGRVEVTKKVDEETVKLAELSSGDLFGEMSLLTGEPTNASVSALEDAFVLRLSKKRFDELVLSNEKVLSLIGKLSDARAEENDKVLSHQLDSRGAVLV